MCWKNVKPSAAACKLSCAAECPVDAAAAVATAAANMCYIGVHVVKAGLHAIAYLQKAGSLTCSTPCT
jgi:hypothetical protein